MWLSTIGCIVTLTCSARGTPRRRRAARGASPTHRLVTAQPLSSRPARGIAAKALHEMGYVEGQNLSIEFRHGEGNAALLPTLAAELVGFPAGGPRGFFSRRNARGPSDDQSDSHHLHERARSP